MNTHVRERDTHARRLFIEVTPELRRVLEMVAEAAVDALDQIDGDPDLEPSFGYLAPGVVDETEIDGEDEEDDPAENDGDAEPTLGAPEKRPPMPGWGDWWGDRTSIGSQTHWADGARGDHEREEENEHGGDILDEPHDAEDEDPGEDDGTAEPELSALEWGNQEAWAYGGNDDCELDPAEAGIGDLDGLQEQTGGAL